MIYTNINNLKENMVLGKDIVDFKTNRVLLRKGVKLTNNQINYLKDKGYRGFYIEDERYKDIIVDDIISDELRQKALLELENFNIEGTLENAKSIVNEILKNKDVTLDTLDVNNDEYEHSLRVAEMSIIVGNYMGIKEENLVDLAAAALLHDAGKKLKDSKNIKNMNINEPFEYKDALYPIYSYKMIQNFPNVKATIKVGVLTHNMNEDGSNNYFLNSNLKQHLYGKIIHVADVYDQLVCEQKESPSEAIEFLSGSCNSNFNTSVVLAFRKCIPVYPIGTMVTLSNNIKGYVLKNNKSNPIRPIIILENGEHCDLMDSEYINITIVDNVQTKYDLKRAIM